MPTHAQNSLVSINAIRAQKIQCRVLELFHHVSSTIVSLVLTNKTPQIMDVRPDYVLPTIIQNFLFFSLQSSLLISLV